MSEDAGLEPRTVATLALAVRPRLDFIHKAVSHHFISLLRKIPNLNFFKKILNGIAQKVALCGRLE